nr:hypothetical protein BaRGS_017144 [Batillaria attramentaria]
MWRDLDLEERDRLKLEARERYQAYRMEYLKFLDGLSDQERNQYFQSLKSKRESREIRRHRKELRKFGRPKRPPNAYLLFVRSSRLERGDAPLGQFTKGLVEYWKQMPKEEKEIYEDDAKLEREKYYRDMAEWEDQMRKIGREDLIRKRSQRRPRKKAATKAKKKSAAGKKATRGTAKKASKTKTKKAVVK